MNKNNNLDEQVEAQEQILASGDLQINLRKQQVYFQNKPLKLPFLSYQLLKELMGAWPQTRSQDDLIQAVWGKVQVQNSTLNQRVKLLRQSLKENGCDPACIALVRGLGYRFSEEVVTLSDKKPADKAIKTSSKKGWKTFATLVIAFALVSSLLKWGDRHPNQPDSTQSLAQEKKRKSITVVPFVSNSYASTTDHYLGNSFSNEILDSLSDIRALQVIAHDRLTRQKLIDLNTSEIGKQLKVDNVIRGNITQVADGFNIDIQLFSTDSGDTLWAKNYHVSETELYFLKTDIVRDIKTLLLPDDVQQLHYRADPNLVNPKAYDLYLKAMDYHERNSRKDNLNALLLVKNAYALSPSCLDIISGYAAVLNSGISLGSISDSYIEQAENIATKAIELYPSIANGYVELARSHMLQQDYDIALINFDKALSLSPDDVDGLTGLSKIQIKNNKFKQAFENIELLKILDPGSTNSLLLSGDVFFTLNLYTQAHQNYKAVIEVEPDNIDGLIGLARISIKQGEFITARKYHQLANDFSPHSVKPFYLLMDVLFAQKQYQQLINNVEYNREVYVDSIYSQKIKELAALSQLLVNPAQNLSAITQKVNDYKQVIASKDTRENSFLYLLRLLDVTGQTDEIAEWRNIENKVISDRQKMVL